MNERIKALRKALGLTQQEFANRIGAKQNTVATYEMGRCVPSGPMISNICREFHVSDSWLKTGEGEMFQPTVSSGIDKLVEEYKLGPTARKLIEILVRLPEDDLKVVCRFIKTVADGVEDSDQSGKEPWTDEELREAFEENLAQSKSQEENTEVS